MMNEARNGRWQQVAVGCLLPLACHIQADVWTEVDSEIAWSEPQQAFTKAEVILRTEWNGRVNEHTDFTVIPRLRTDLADSLSSTDARPDSYPQEDIQYNGPLAEDSHNRLELAEAFADFIWSHGSVRAGKQQVVWGQADGLKVLDVVNPQDYREFNLPDFEDSRIPTWMMNSEFRFESGATLQWLLIPDMTFNELADAGTDFAMTSPELAPSASAGVDIRLHNTERPSGGTLETGLRWSMFAGGWDLTANYFRFFQDNAVIYRSLDTSSVTPLVDVRPVYERSTLWGVTASNAFSDWVIRLEAGYYTDAYFIRDDLVDKGIRNSPELAYVTGLDYQGLTDTMISYQLFHSHITDYDAAVVRREDSIRHTMKISRNFWNETLEVEFFVLLNRDYNDGQARTKVTYQVNDNWSVWAGGDYFYGDQQGPFGQFTDASRMIAGWHTSF
ncbi:MAG: TonB-dependent receptor [Pseudomonadota bacterium]|nr:TonB-dependent receptor [Pseudomonadota bacterium]